MKKQVVSLLILLSFSTMAFAATDKALFDKGVSLLKLNQFQGAVEIFSQLISQAPENPDAYKNRGVAYMKLGQYDPAIADFEKTRQIKPDLKGLYSNLGVAWYYKGEYAQAIKNYNMEIALTPDNYYAFFNRAICWSELGELPKALDDVNRSVELSPDFYLALCLKGDLLVKMGKVALARDAYKVALATEPDAPYAKEQLAAISESTDSGPAGSEQVTSESTDSEPVSSEKAQSEQADSGPAVSEQGGSGQTEESLADEDKGVEEVTPVSPHVIKRKIESESIEEEVSGEADMIAGNDAVGEDAPPDQSLTGGAEQPGPAEVGIDEVETTGAGPESALSSSKFELQAGAYLVQANAEETKAILLDKGFPAKVMEITRPDDRHWFLVRIGVFDSRELAKAAEDAAEKTLGQDLIIRPYGKF